jgi:uncharacterized iron-regulated membrane protein
VLRRWHRWAAIPAGLFLCFIALTGVLLHADMIRLGNAPPGHESRPGGPPDAPHVRINAATGAVIAEPPPPPADFHYILQDLHAGYFFGWTGRFISILTGLSVLILAVTGLQLWWKMRCAGGKGVYWQ